MYGPFILMIIASSILALSAVILILSNIFDSIYCKWEDSKPREPIEHYYFDILTSERIITECSKEYEKDKLKYEEKLKEHNKLKPKVKGVSEGIFYTLIATIAVTIGILIVTGLIAIIDYFGNRKELNTWKHKYEMIQLVEENGSETENVALSQTKIEFNTWLSEAKSSLDYYGNWSGYYFIRDEVENLEYLT